MVFFWAQATNTKFYYLDMDVLFLCSQSKLDGNGLKSEIFFST